MTHYYDRQGKPVYEVLKADGKGMRSTTIRDARKLNLVISVTEIIKVAANPSLDNWIQNQLLLAALKNKDLKISDSLTESQWKGIVLSASKKIGETASNRGTEIHNKLEQIFLTGEVDTEDQEFLLPAIKALQEGLGNSIKLGVTEKSFAHDDGFGGKVDLHGVDKTGKQGGYVVDFKTKSTEKLDDSILYDSYSMQLAAYRIGLDIPKAKCYNLFISTAKPGLVRLYEWPEEEIQKGEKMFYHLLEFWKLKNL